MLLSVHEKIVAAVFRVQRVALVQNPLSSSHNSSISGVFFNVFIHHDKIAYPFRFERYFQHAATVKNQRRKKKKVN